MPPQVTWRVSQRHLETWSEHTFPCTRSCFTEQMALTYSQHASVLWCLCKYFLLQTISQKFTGNCDRFAWMIDLGKKKMKLRVNHLQEFNRLIIRDYKDWGIYKTCASNISRVAYENVFARHSRRHLIIISSARKNCVVKLIHISCKLIEKVAVVFTEKYRECWRVDAPQVTWRVSQRHLETWSEHTFPCTSSCFTEQMALTYSNSPVSHDIFASIYYCKLFLKILTSKMR